MQKKRRLQPIQKTHKVIGHCANFKDLSSGRRNAKIALCQKKCDTHPGVQLSDKKTRKMPKEPLTISFLAGILA